jgi:PTH1 family peptidyl-tRNA hydrolase
MAPIRLIAGLGNPGPRYETTRHNVGANFAWHLARRFNVSLNGDTKFKGYVGRGDVLGFDVRILVPSTFMNLSGESIGALARFYKIPCVEMLVAHDEMAFEPGQLRLKSGGGDNGHNGIRSVIASLGGEREFQRLRIGVGHPGDRDRVTAYLTSQRMPEAEREAVEKAFMLPEATLSAMLSGDYQKAMNAMHAPGDQ